MMTDRPRLTHISLFSGIGGDTLAAEWAGFETVLLCEIDPFCQRVLHKHWPDVPIIGDVRDVTAQNIVAYTHNGGLPRDVREKGNEGPTETPNPKSSSRSQERGVISTAGCESAITLLSAGVPCQPASTAGKRRGKADDRWLWPQAIRVLSELKPTWATFENPAGIGSLGELGGLSEVGTDAAESVGDREAVELDNICRDIEACGYEVQPVCIPACAVGAPHRRDRIFIVCHSQRSGGASDRRQGRWASVDGHLLGYAERQEDANEASGSGENATHSELCRPESGHRGTWESFPIARGGPRSDTNTEGIGWGTRWAESNRLNKSGSGPDTNANGNGGKARLSGQEPRKSGDGGIPNDNITEFNGWQEDWLTAASRLCAVDDGLSAGLARPGRNANRTQKLKACGNAIVPQQIYSVFKAIADVEYLLAAVRNGTVMNLGV